LKAWAKGCGRNGPLTIIQSFPEENAPRGVN